MQSSICRSCRSVIRVRLRQQIQHLQNIRRDRSSGPSSQPLESWYWETSPPSPKNLAAAKWFFDVHPPRKLWTANEWISQGQHDESQALTPEVAFLGRSNAGKSSLLNALLNTPSLNKVGSTPGKTKVLHAYGLSATLSSKKTKDKQTKSVDAVKNLVTVLDAPGYGHASQGDWGDAIVKYLKERKHLRRVFLLVSAHHGLKLADSKMLDMLRSYAVPHQVIVTKCDRLEPPSKRRHLLQATMQKIQKAVQPDYPNHTVAALGEAIAVGWLGDGMLNAKVRSNQMQGISAVQWAVLRAAGLEGYAASFDKLEERVQRQYYALAQHGTALGNEITKPSAEDQDLRLIEAASPPSVPRLELEQLEQAEQEEDEEVDNQTDDAPSDRNVTTGIDDFLYATGALETPNQPSRQIPYSANKTTRRRRTKQLKRKILKSQFPPEAPRRRSGSEINAMAHTRVMTGRLDAMLPAVTLKGKETRNELAVRDESNERQRVKAGKSKHTNPFKNTGATSLFGG